MIPDQVASGQAIGGQPAGPATRQPPLWRNGDFTLFWIGETASMLGSQITFIALPLVAVLTLDAGGGELGLLRFMEYLPFLLLTLPFGVWADRRHRRPLMILSYLVRGLLVAAVPLLAAVGLLNISVLAAVALAVGAGHALFEVCWMSYVPGLVERHRLMEAMGKMTVSHAAAEVSGPGIGGLLVQLVSAPFALLLDALSYLVGAVTLLRIRRREPEVVRAVATPATVLAELIEGLRFAFGEPHIRGTAYAAAMGNFFTLITETAFLLYAVRELHFAPALLGVVLMAVGAGGLVGAAVANVATRRWPLGRIYVVARIFAGLAALLLPFAGGSTPMAAATCMASFFLAHAAIANTNVLNASLRQVLTPDRIRARMNASVRTLVFGVLPLGGIAAGLLTTTIGLRPALWVGAIGFAASVVPILASPIPRMRTLPTQPPESADLKSPPA